MNIQRINITTEQFRQIPDHERALIVVLTHALNEVNVLNKLIFLCANFDIEPLWKAHAHAAQAFVLARLLIGKLNEAWNAIQKGYFGSKLSKKYAKHIEPSATKALNELKTYFGRKNLLYEVRNNFSFHYSLEHAVTTIPDDTPTDDLTIFLHETQGNSLYYFAEYLMSKALIDSISPNDPESALNTLLTEMSTVIDCLNEFVQGLLFVVFDNHIGEDVLRQSVKEIDLGIVARSIDVRIPYFFEIVRTSDVPINLP